MKNKIKKIDFVLLFLMLFSVLFIIYPAKYGIISIKYSILSLLLISIIIILFRKVKININEKYYFWIILLLSIITRIGVVLLFNSSITQVSDFGVAFTNSENLIFKKEVYRVFTHWIMYPVVLNKVYKIFGYSQLVALFTNAFILILLNIIIYKISFILFKSKKYAFIATLLYIFWPANILYTLILTQEHLCALLLLSSIYLFFKLDKKDFNFKNKFKQILTIIMMGIFLAFSVFLKNFVPVIIVAIIIYFIMDMMNKKKLSLSSKYIIPRIVFIIILFVTFTLSKNIIYMKIDNIVGERVTRNIIPCYLNVGFRDEGVYNSNNYNMYFNKMIEYDYDEKKVNSEILSELLNYWKNGQNKYSIFTLLDYKAKIIFGGDIRISWVNHSLLQKGNIKIISFFEKYINKVNNLYFLVIVIFMIFGLFKLNNEKNLYVFLCYLIIFGSLLLILLVEAQNRYMYAIQPFICIMSIYGYEWYERFLISKYNFIKINIK